MFLRNPNFDFPQRCTNLCGQAVRDYDVSGGVSGEKVSGVECCIPRRRSARRPVADVNRRRWTSLRCRNWIGDRARIRDNDAGWWFRMQRLYCTILELSEAGPRIALTDGLRIGR